MEKGGKKKKTNVLVHFFSIPEPTVFFNEKKNSNIYMYISFFKNLCTDIFFRFSYFFAVDFGLFVSCIVHLFIRP